MMVAAVFVGTEIAQAADISFSGSIRTRYEHENRTAMTVNQEPQDITATQVRLNVKANINPDTSAFIQMQDERNWGAVGGNSYDVQDTEDGLGLHQAFFTLKNFAGTGLTAKVGRQEVVLDGHRLFGHTGWTTGAQTHDGLRLSHAHDNMTMNYIYLANVEQGAAFSFDPDVSTHVVHNNFQGVLGGALSTYVVFTDDHCGVADNECTDVTNDNQWFTLGFRQAGKMYGLDYRAEYYYQTGKADGADAIIAPTNVANAYGTAHNLSGFTPGSNRDAYMFGVRVGKSFKNVTWKPKITLWYDYLSGQTDEGMEEGDWESFDTHFDTGHKFYGFMDFFLNNTGSNTNYLGLQDIAIKLVMKPAPKWTFKADVHQFHTAQSVGSNPDVSTITGLLGVPSSNATSNIQTLGSGDRGAGTELGTEVDLTLVHAYNPNVKLSFGYSQFMAETLFHDIDDNSAVNGYSNTSHWSYVQAAVKF